MNFKNNRFFTGSIHFIFGAFFLVLGIIAVFLPWFPLWQNYLIYLLYNQALIVSLFGLGAVVIGLSILAYAFFNAKRSSIFFKIGSHSITIKESIIENYLENYWKKRFPQENIAFTVELKQYSINIDAHFPSIALEEQEIFIEQIKTDLEHLFAFLLGPFYTVYFTASFTVN